LPLQPPHIGGACLPFSQFHSSVRDFFVAGIFLAVYVTQKKLNYMSTFQLIRLAKEERVAFHNQCVDVCCVAMSAGTSAMHA
jgi:hypothetical protein